jgi:hypothetical protein
MTIVEAKAIKREYTSPLLIAQKQAPRIPAAANWKHGL